MNSEFTNYVELAGSHKMAPHGERREGIDKGMPITISVYVRPKEPLLGLILGTGTKKLATLARGRYKSKHG
ncbi:MAG TPA: hypothetical protein VK517_02845, partial [Cyclobacteriaceae bacterium]|nr:hypothetical protein [Cyclobacteriaceae bacterium]